MEHLSFFLSLSLLEQREIITLCRMKMKKKQNVASHKTGERFCPGFRIQTIFRSSSTHRGENQSKNISGRERQHNLF